MFREKCSFYLSSYLSTYLSPETKLTKLLFTLISRDYLHYHLLRHIIFCSVTAAVVKIQNTFNNYNRLKLDLHCKIRFVFQLYKTEKWLMHYIYLKFLIFFSYLKNIFLFLGQQSSLYFLFPISNT